MTNKQASERAKGIMLELVAFRADPATNNAKMIRKLADVLVRETAPARAKGGMTERELREDVYRISFNVIRGWTRKGSSGNKKVVDKPAP